VTFTVIWAPSVRNRLAELWVDRSSDRASITKAADEIDMRLGSNPIRWVRARGIYWELTIPPLRVLCQISEEDRMVKVVQVRWTSR